MLSRLLKSIRARSKDAKSFRRAAYAHREAFSRKPEKHQQISKILESYHLANGLKHPFQAYKLLELDRLLHLYRPQNILELGTGSSSKMFIAYLQQSPSALLTCVDENQLWLDEIAKVATSTNLSDRINLWCAPREIRETNIVEFRYQTLPEIKTNLIFVEGP